MPDILSGESFHSRMSQLVWFIWRSSRHSVPQLTCLMQYNYAALLIIADILNILVFVLKIYFSFHF